MKTKENRAVTLIALAVTIIVMLILAGVTISTIAGNNGIVTKAREAKISQEEAQTKEYLNFLLDDYNTSKYFSESEDGFTDYLRELKDKEKIENFLLSDEDTLILQYKEKYYEIEQQNNFYRVKSVLSEDVNKDGKYYIITAKNIKNGKIDILAGCTYIILDEVSGQNFNFVIPEGDAVTIKILGDMEIDNRGYKRSAIDISSGGTLNLYVYGNVHVDSGYGEDANGNTPGKGGYAGIHVPKGATLNLFGKGILYSNGGNAGNGEISNQDTLNAGGGGAGATCCTGAGGYTGGGASNYATRAVNGSYGGECTRCSGMYWGGGGYFSGPTGRDTSGINVKDCFGGMGGTSYYIGHRAGDGGTAGKGGNVKISSDSQVYAYNGNRYTDGTGYNDGLNQCPIYLQAGISPARYVVASYGTHDISPHKTYGLTNGITLSRTSALDKNKEKLSYVNPAYDNVKQTDKIITMNELLKNVNMSNQGIGSGAGYIEVSNGTFIVDNNMN